MCIKDVDFTANNCALSNGHMNELELKCIRKEEEKLSLNFKWTAT